MPATPTANPAAELMLVPTPTRVQRGRGRVAVPEAITVAGAPGRLLAAIPNLRAGAVKSGAWCLCAIDPAGVPLAGDEAYRLVIDPDPRNLPRSAPRNAPTRAARVNSHVRITARTDTGLRWGLVTLAQLLRQFPRHLPELTIDDAPQFPIRGFMLDIARDRVPTMKSLYELVDHMASLKLNHLQLYNEHAFAYAGHEAVWCAASPVTPAEMKALDGYAAARGVALTANQNSLGHFERWLKVPGYAPLGEIGRTMVINAPWGLHFCEPATLFPGDPRSLQLVASLHQEMAPLCSGGYVNIGCDEPFELGQGRSRQACLKRGRARVFGEYVAKVAQVIRGLGKRPQFWCDPHPNEDESLRGDIVALVWGYEFDSDFATRLKAHADAGREVWVCPGTSSWNTITGRTWNRRGNLDAAASQGLAHGAKGFLNTEWGDNGHRQQWPLTLMGLADGAQASWHGAGGYCGKAAGLQVLGSPALGAWLEELGNADKAICLGETPKGGRRRHNATALFLEMDFTHFHEVTDPNEEEAWRDMTVKLADLAARLPAGLPGGLPGGDDALVVRECRHAVTVAQWAADYAYLRRTCPTMAVRRALQGRIADILGEHRDLWLARSRYGGLEDSCQRYKKHGYRP